MREEKAYDLPATRDQVWQCGRQWWLIGLAVVFTACCIWIFAPHGGGWRAGRIAGGVAFVGLTVLFWWMAWFFDPKVRQIRYLRAFPWQVCEAEVNKSVNPSYSVADIHHEGHRYIYRIDPVRDEIEYGKRDLWVAGELGASLVVVSFRDGACTSLASGQEMKKR